MKDKQIEFYFVWDDLIIIHGTMKDCIELLNEYKEVHKDEKHHYEIYKVTKMLDVIYKEEV